MSLRFTAAAIPVGAAWLALGAGASAAHAQAQEGQIIASVLIRGVDKTNPQIVQIIVSDAGIREGQPFKAAAIADVRRAILEKGLYSDVYIKTDTTADRKASVVIEVFENPVIQLVRIKTNVPLTRKGAPSQKTILPLLGSKSGLVVNINTVRADARIIQDQYRKAGYEASLSELENVYDATTNTLTFPVTITVIDAIEVQGLNKTRPYVVTRTLRSKVGEPLNREVVTRDTTRIFATGLFADVQNPRTEPLDEGHAKLIIPVQEQRTGQVQVGLGYSVRQRLTGTLEIAENNFRGRGQGVSASWTVGGLTSRNQYELGFSEPWLDKNNTSLSVNLYTRFSYRFNSVLSSNATLGTNDNPYYEDRTGGSVTLSRPVTEFTRIFTTVRSERIRANNLDANYGILSNDQVQTIQGALVSNGRSTSISFRSLTNTRDNERDPAAGAFVSPSIELGASQFDYRTPRVNPAYVSSVVTPDTARVLLQNRTQNGPFSKYNLDLRRYVSLDGPRRNSLADPKKVVAARALFGVAQGNIGFSEQYFMGGADSLRGYYDDRFWGNYLFLASTELRIPLANNGDIGGVLFADVGDAWGATTNNRGNIASFEQHNGFSPHVGVGFGVRIKTPVGPVRLDYGIGETQRTHFSIGQAF